MKEGSRCNPLATAAAAASLPKGPRKQGPRSSSVPCLEGMLDRHRMWLERRESHLVLWHCLGLTLCRKRAGCFAFFFRRARQRLVAVLIAGGLSPSSPTAPSILLRQTTHLRGLLYNRNHTHAIEPFSPPLIINSLSAPRLYISTASPLPPNVRVAKGTLRFQPRAAHPPTHASPSITTARRLGQARP